MPALVDEWLKVDRERRIRPLAEFLEANPDVWRQWEQEHIDRIVGSLPLSVLEAHPTIVATGLMVLSNPIALTRFGHAALSCGLEIGEERLPSLVSAAIRAGSAGTELLMKLAEVGGAQTSIYEATKSDFNPGTWSEYVTWLSKFDAQVTSDRPVQRLSLLKIGLPLVRDASPEDYSIVEALSRPLLGDQGYLHETHKLWRDESVISRMTLKSYIGLCTDTINGRRYADMLLDNILSGRKAVWLEDLSISIPFRRWQLAICLAHRLSTFVAEVGHVNLSQLVGDNFAVLDGIFEAVQNSDNADMLAITIDEIRRLLPEGYLTPVEYLLKALCFGGRFEQAHRVAKVHRGLRIGGGRISAAAYIEQTQRTIPANSEPVSPDFRIIIRQILGTDKAPPKQFTALPTR